MALLQRFPRHNNSVYETFAAAGPASWQPFFDSLYFNNGTGVLAPGKIGCGRSIHGCGQVIGSFPSVLAYTTRTKHAAFLQWWSGWIAERTSPVTGTLCPLNATAQDLFDSLGGGMATHGIQLGIAAGDPRHYPFQLARPQALLAFALSLQNKTSGVWIEPKQAGSRADTCLGSMTLDGIFQTVRSAEQLQRNHEPTAAQAMAAAVRACDALLGTSAKALNDEAKVMKHYAQNSHSLPNVLAAVGECARAFPFLVRTRRQWGCCARYV